MSLAKGIFGDHITEEILGLTFADKCKHVEANYRVTNPTSGIPSKNRCLIGVLSIYESESYESMSQ